MDNYTKMVLDVKSQVVLLQPVHTARVQPPRKSTEARSKTTHTDGGHRPTQDGNKQQAGRGGQDIPNMLFLVTTTTVFVLIFVAALRKI